MKNIKKFILASKSPRRKQILEKENIDFEVFVPNVTEVTQAGALETVEFNAELKAKSAAEIFPDRIVIAADTVVALDNKILEKPDSMEEAVLMLQNLSGRTHTVFTAVSIAANGKIYSFYDESRVKFKNLTLEIIEDYFKICDPLDKAGAYNIDENGEQIIEKIIGSYENIMGLPIVKLRKKLKKLSFL